MQKVDKEKTRYYLAKIHILFRGNFRTQDIYCSVTGTGLLLICQIKIYEDFK